MPPIKPRRQDPTMLIWEYLDGDISPTRAQTLSTMLTEREQVREQFVESAVLHGMLFEYYRNEQAANAQQTEADQADASTRRRKRGRSSAA